jgi:hypothetical protein
MDVCTPIERDVSVADFHTFASQGCPPIAAEAVSARLILRHKIGINS